MKYVLCVALAVAVLSGADATGTWVGTLTPEGADGGGLPARLVLKQDGQTLTGTAGPDAGEQRPIENGKAENGKLTFDLPNDASVMRFTLTQDGDTISGDVVREREGQTQKAKLAVKRTP